MRSIESAYSFTDQSSMYERFTDRAREVMRGACVEAQRWNHDYIGTEHELLALVREEHCAAARLLVEAGVDLAQIRRNLVHCLTPGPPKRKNWRSFLRTWARGDRLPQTPRAKRVIECAMEESRAMRHNCIGTVHVLLGFLRDEHCVAFQVLTNFGVSLDEIRHKAITLSREQLD